MIDSHDVSIPQLIRVVEEHPSGADDEVLICVSESMATLITSNGGERGPTGRPFGLRTVAESRCFRVSME